MKYIYIYIYNIYVFTKMKKTDDVIEIIQN